MSVIRYFKRLQVLNNVLKNRINPTLQINRSVILASAGDSKDVSNTEKVLVKLKSDPDKFGTFAEEALTEDDLKEERYLSEKPSPSQKLSTKKYANIIKNLIQQRKIKEAIDVLEVRMIKEDRVKPENYIYNLLLGACGRVGYTKKAFMLYNDMKKRGLKVTGGTYTALFNACSNSPWQLTDGLSRAKHLRDIMIEKGYQPNDTNYNAMIKAFGRCGDYLTAFSLVDEMISKGIPLKDDTINFMLQACISDKEAGFRHALLIWRKLVQKKVKPSIYTFNLLLRSARDCNLGDIEATKKCIDDICSSSKLLEPGSNVEQMQIQENNNTDTKLLAINSVSNPRPDLLAETPHLGNIISLSEVIKPEHKLLLLGGCSGFLETMKRYECQPDIKTFTQLLDCIPSTLAAEKDLMASMEIFKIKPDIDFYNMLIKRRSIRCDYENAKKVLTLMQKQNYRPNLITYGVLAIGCKNKEEAILLLEEMKEKSYSFNPEILGAMLHQACYHFNFDYVLYIMEYCLKENVQPNKKFMETLKEFHTNVKKLYFDKKLNEKLHRMYNIFRLRYKSWLQEVQIDVSEEEHPWKQFREINDNEYKIKVKDSERFKPRHTSRFKVKTIDANKK